MCSLHPLDAEHKGFGHSPTSILNLILEIGFKNRAVVPRRTACSNNASFQSAYEPICAAILYMSFHNVFCRSSQPCIRSELQWCGFVFLPKGFDKACTAGITRSMGHLFNTEVGMDKQLRCLGHPTVFQIRTNGDSITKGEAKFEFFVR